MPVPHPPIRAHPGKPLRTWSDAARDRQVVTIRCNRCRRSENFLAEDFALVFRPEEPAHVPPFACSRCKTKDNLDLALRVTGSEDEAEALLRPFPAERMRIVAEGVGLRSDGGRGPQ